ncbi:hypothetical protein O1R50_19085 [Glycomyces luteolus]|uniref:Uncharacterized protein n=1 Tax=Glycomyces luteolus TaxID=2670330 RepID=A0A9X3PCP3_9ACTN|nr:hypothetical protein [Glycomyces luteolus]MDA1361741.1 hypothetical protein [Glycomyces luteolus]
MTYQPPQWQPGQQQYQQQPPYPHQPPPPYAPQAYQQAPQPPAAPYGQHPHQPQVYTGPLPGGDPKAQAWKNYGMQWLLGLGFLAVIGIFAVIYNLATGEW